MTDAQESGTNTRLSLKDSRRLTGPNLLMAGTGAVLDVAVEGRPVADVAAAWQAEARRLLDAVGWTGETLHTRTFAGGASLALSAPIDALYAATEINEAAWAAAVDRLTGKAATDEAADVGRLRTLIEDEQNPVLRRLCAAAQRHGVSLLADDEYVSVGLGAGALTWPADALPDPADVDWKAARDVPVVLVTGTNGKSTTVRLLAHVLQTAGTTAGFTSTDFIKVGDDVIARGDYSGPGGGRTLLRDRRVEVGLLEAARGGLLRRGLTVERATAALITNVAEDHLGEYGIETLDDLIRAKFIVHRAVAADGVLVLNADDAGLVRQAAQVRGTVCWFSLDAANAVVQAHRAGGGRACFVESGQIVWAEGDRRFPLLHAADVPFTLDGAARHNVANALAAAALARLLGVAPDALAEGLRTFRNDPADNPGRTNFFEVDGATVLVDFAHNPHGLAAVVETVRRLPARRRLVTLSQAGDRSDDDIRNLVRTARHIDPDHVVVMALPGYERGRAPGEVAALIDDELRRLGTPTDAVTHVTTCLEGVQAAVEWAEPGDLLLLLVYTQRDAVFRFLEEAGATVRTAP